MSEPSTIPVLPLDIIESIVDILRNNGKGLQKHIFSSIHIKMGNSGSSVKLPTDEAFEQLILGTSAIAKYVRRLNIRVIQRPSSPFRYSFDQVPQHLTRLKSLVISLWHQSPVYSDDWNALSSSIQCSLLNLMHHPTLSYLGLDTIQNFPISNLITCTNLKHLSVEGLVIAEYDEAASSLLHKLMQLQALDIEIRGSETARLLVERCPDGQPVLDFSVLEKISIRFDCDWKEAAVPTREIFRNVRRLTDIYLEVDFDDTDFRAMQFAKTVTPSLQTLRRIKFEFGGDNGLSDDLLVGLCDELEDISGENNLESIGIKVHVDTDEGCHTGAEWGRLERILLKSGWPMLKHVSLTIFLNTWCKRRIESPLGLALMSLPQTQFTGLMAGKHLDFQYSVKGLTVY